MTDPALADDPAHPRDDIMRSQACGLVDDQCAIHKKYSNLCHPLCPLWLNTASSTREVTEESRSVRRKKPPADPAKARERLFQRAAKLLAAKQRSVEELRERLLAGRGATARLG
jgi:hypothetical protein